ncbi:hypothetical protein E4U14_000796 [Claviceps sp. LM454 group G7]|nr:hypothetical protein E4U14_000796 [Claviceps sp. LM454 group G7]
MSENDNGSHTRKNINSPLTGFRKLDSASSEQTGVGDVTCGQKVQKLFRRSAPRITGGEFEVTVPPLECQFEDLKKVDGVPFTTYVEAYQYCQQHHQNHPQDYYGRFDESDATPPDDEHAEEYTEQDEDVPREAWQELANIIPQHDPEGCEL